MSCTISGDKSFNIFLHFGSKYLKFSLMDWDKFVFRKKFYNDENYLYRQALIPSHEVYLPYDLSASYETSRLLGNMQTAK